MSYLRWMALLTACITLFATFASHAVVVRHGARGTTVHRAAPVRATPARGVVAPARRVWVPRHYYNGAWVAGAYLTVNCNHWVPGHYYRKRWINGHCAD